MLFHVVHVTHAHAMPCVSLFFNNVIGLVKHNIPCHDTPCHAMLQTFLFGPWTVFSKHSMVKFHTACMP